MVLAFLESFCTAQVTEKMPYGGLQTSLRWAGSTEESLPSIFSLQLSLFQSLEFLFSRLPGFKEVSTTLLD
jgi:hypothetical protein